MCAVIVNQKSGQRLRNAIDALRKDFGVPPTATMSWKNHIKTASRRNHASRTLSKVDGVTLLYAYYEKSKLRPGTYATDRQRSYDYLAHKMHKAILWYTALGGHENASINIRFGHVKNHDHKTTKVYLQKSAVRDNLPIGRQRELKWVAADTHPESQAADIYAGFLRSAIWPDEFGNVDGQHLLRVWHLIRQADLCGKGGYCAIPLGIFSMPENHLVTEMEWFPCTSCKYATQRPSGREPT